MATHCPECKSKIQIIDSKMICIECDHEIFEDGSIKKPDFEKAKQEQKAVAEQTNTIEALRRKLFADTFAALDSSPNPQQTAYNTIVECEQLILKYAQLLGEAKVKHAAASKYLYVDEQQRTEVHRRIESREYELTHGRQKTQIEIDEAKRAKALKTPRDNMRAQIVQVFRLAKAAGAKSLPESNKVYGLLLASKKYAPAMISLKIVEDLIADINKNGGR